MLSEMISLGFNMIPRGSDVMSHSFNKIQHDLHNFKKNKTMIKKSKYVVYSWSQFQENQDS